VKWKTVLDHPCAVRYVVCNAAEGEPGTFKDRYLLRRNPYAVLEGLLIAAHVVGTKTIYIGIKANFEPEIRRLTQAIHEMRTAGLISAINIEISPGPVEYLFGEEKALLNQIKVGLPLPVKHTIRHMKRDSSESQARRTRRWRTTSKRLPTYHRSSLAVPSAFGRSELQTRQERLSTRLAGT
jgi:Na+-translocating ferredoxin:NAD+ oxidoreductase RnfC subunit